MILLLKITQKERESYYYDSLKNKCVGYYRENFQMLMWLPKNANEIKVKINVKDITTRSWIFVMLKNEMGLTGEVRARCRTQLYAGCALQG